MNKKILFLTGTRADFGKLKPLIRKVDNSKNFDYSIFITGMHTVEKYGYTVKEVKSCFSNTFTYINKSNNNLMEEVLANTIYGLSKYLSENRHDLIVVHGDRVETLAGAIIGALRNTLVVHIEGGEVSGTVDELIRHSISKLAHFHLVANENAKKRIIQLGEVEKNIFIIGSPDIDVMISENLPSIEFVKDRYEIPFKNYAIVIFHSVTTEIDTIESQCDEMMKALLEINNNFIIIYPNNDYGSDKIFSVYSKYTTFNKFKFYPSIRFEFFLVLLKHSEFIIGNSSVGIREAPVYNIPSINIGSRQNKRYNGKNIINVEPMIDKIIGSISSLRLSRKNDISKDYYFGKGESAKKFLSFLNQKWVWDMSTQKAFVDQRF